MDSMETDDCNMNEVCKESTDEIERMKKRRRVGKCIQLLIDIREKTK